MLAAMMRTLLFAAAFALVTAPVVVHAGPNDQKPVKVAQKSKKGKGKDKDKDKDKDKASERPVDKAAPEGARVDPRTASSAGGDVGAAPATGELGRRGMSRIEFDDRLVQGQTNKANAIYLFERRESALRSLLKKRTDFHEEIDETLE